MMWKENDSVDTAVFHDAKMAASVDSVCVVIGGGRVDDQIGKIL